MSRHVVHVVSDGAGAFTYEKSLFAMVTGIAIEVGTLGAPAIAVTDSVFGTSIYEADPATDATDEPWRLVAGTLRIEVTGADPETSGRIRFLLET